LKAGLVERGTIKIPGAGSRADHTVSVSGSVNYD
jgi:hypothetical protein